MRPSQATSSAARTSGRTSIAYGSSPSPATSGFLAAAKSTGDGRCSTSMRRRVARSQCPAAEVVIGHLVSTGCPTSCHPATNWIFRQREFDAFVSLREDRAQCLEPPFDLGELDGNPVGTFVQPGHGGKGHSN